MIYHIFAFVGCVLGIFNTVILWRRALIHKDDLKTLVEIVERLASLTPTAADDITIRKIRKIIEDHT